MNPVRIMSLEHIGTIKNEATKSGFTRAGIPVIQPQFVQGLPFMLMNSSHSPRKGYGAVMCSRILCSRVSETGMHHHFRENAEYVTILYIVLRSLWIPIALEQIRQLHSEHDSRTKQAAPLHFEGRHER